MEPASELDSQMHPLVSVSSLPFRISRITLARLATEMYVRQFWWYVAIVPAFGVVMLITGQGILQIIGYFAVLWPFSIPARAVFSTNKAARLFTTGTQALLRDDGLYFPKADGVGLKLELESIRGLQVRQGHFLIGYRASSPLPLPAFIPVPLSAFVSDEDREVFGSDLQSVVEHNL